jgi:Sec-independent protein translocase protein TatA
VATIGIAEVIVIAIVVFLLFVVRRWFTGLYRR